MTCRFPGRTGAVVRVPNWGVYMMFVASLVGTILLFAELRARGFPGPFTG